MSVPKTVAKAILHRTLGEKRTKAFIQEYRDIRGGFQAYLSPEFRRSVRYLEKFREKHQGERCFIIGNGPSLNEMDLSPLRHEYTFGMNRFYLMFEELGFSTTYYVSVNRLVLEQCAEDIEAIPCPKFVGWKAWDLFAARPDLMFLRSRSGPRFFSDVARQGVWEGATVTYVAMQLAYYMGFDQVILIGVDHSFSTKGEPHKTVVSQGEDPNHFHPEYFGKGFKWQLPDLETSELAYAMAKEQFEGDGRQILDATIGGKLEVFPKVPYTEMF